MFDVDFSHYIASFIAIGSIHFGAVAMPGPDFALTIRNSLLYSRAVGLAGAMGTTTGILIHLTYTIFGIGYLVVEMPWLMNLIRIAGACYLLYLGYASLRKKEGEHSADLDVISDENLKKDAARKKSKARGPLTPWKAYRIGVINNVLNPMVVLLFIGILSIYITPTTPIAVQVVYCIIIMLITVAWFVCVAVFFSAKHIRQWFLRMGPWLERITGAALILFGVNVFYMAVKAL